MITFILGFIAGLIAGVCCLALVGAARDEEDEE